MVEPLREVFPALGLYRITSPRSEKHNCIAWTAGDVTRWWWPEHEPGIYWPPELEREETLSTLVAAFALLGYESCADTDGDGGFERIALYADATGCPSHAARQLASGRWTSKLGRAEDIEHALADLEGEVYGKVVLLMRRRLVGQSH
jgi:hypothetical protein